MTDPMTPQRDVPREPTQAMIAAGRRVVLIARLPDETPDQWIARFFTAMYDAAPAAAPAAPAPDDTMRAALTLIMRNADAAKEPCGMDPESPAAIRNGKLASLAQIAAQGLGLVRGPDLTAAPAPDALVTQADANKALDLLATVFDAYENGDPCYEDGDPESNYMGPAFRLDEDTFTDCADLLNRLRPVTTAAPAAAPAAPAPPELDTTRPRSEQGLYRKFNVSRVDGSDGPSGKHEGCDYFVLDRTHDKYAPAALMAYADACESEYPMLAADLRMWFGASPGKATAPAQAAPTCTRFHMACHIPEACAAHPLGCRYDEPAAAPAPAPDAMRVPNDDEVICPGCTHQFRAVPVNVQAELAALRATVEQQARELAQVMRERNDANRACLEELTRADRAERDLSAARAAIAAADAMRVWFDHISEPHRVARGNYDRLRAAMGDGNG